MNPFLRLGRFLRRPQPPPILRISTYSTFPIPDSAPKFEEERMPSYSRGLCYPVKLGDVSHSRYQVLNKLGFGANSTVWFCHDLQSTLKVYIASSKQNQEVRVLEHLSRIKSDHPGSRMIDKFELVGLSATLDPTSLPEDLLKGALQQLLLALDYLHSEARVVHTDIQAKNIIISAKDDSVFREWAANQATDPIPLKVNGDYTVYPSPPFHRKKGWNGYGMPLLSDFGGARLGEVHEGLIQPDVYRAPEVILGLNWTSKVDIWNVGVLIWDLFEDHHLFDSRGPDGRHSDAHLLADMVAILGPPPSNLLRNSPHSPKYWDSSGQWMSSGKIPDDSLEDSKEYLEGENKNMFLRFVRKDATMGSRGEAERS